jgi:S1-C subfamily serine protease
VGITSTGRRVISAYPFGYYEEPSGGVGTGIIVDEGGYILTNSHVVMDGEAVDNIDVLLSDGREVKGEILWSDRSLDMAIVKIQADNLVAAELGDSSEMKIGAYVAAIGNPLGLDFRGSVSQGVISGLDRTIVTGDASSQNQVRMEGLFQVDAAINKGNSGGPLLNSKGEVIGINTAKAQSGEGMGFAIPIDTAKPIVSSVKETGGFQRVYIGIEPADVSDWLSSYPNVDLGVREGVYVKEVTENGSAQAAGVRKGDVVTEVDGHEVTTSSALIKLLLNYRAGDVIKVTLMRDGQELALDITLTALTEQN